MSKKQEKTNRSDTNFQMEILKTLLFSTQQTSMYRLNKNIKDSTFSTIRRNVYKLRDNGLIRMEIAKIRNASVISLTDRGMATLLLEGNLTKNDLIILAEKVLQKDFSSYNPKQFEKIKPFFLEIWCDSLIEFRKRFNLKYFDEKYFKKTFSALFFDALEKSIEKHHLEFEKEGIWQLEPTQEQKDNDFAEFLKELHEE